MAEKPEKRFSFVSSALAADTSPSSASAARRVCPAATGSRSSWPPRTPPSTWTRCSAPRRSSPSSGKRGTSPSTGSSPSSEQLQQADVYTFYRAVLVPKLWWLSLTHHNQVFLDQTVPQMVEACLKDGGLTSPTSNCGSRRTVPPGSSPASTGKATWTFVSRWLERAGHLLLLRAGRRRREGRSSRTPGSPTGRCPRATRSATAPWRPWSTSTGRR